MKRPKVRYVVKTLPETVGSKKWVWRVYDLDRASYPGRIKGYGRTLGDYPTEAEAQAIADELNDM